MKDNETQTGLEGRIRRVIRHIFDNPAGDLSVDALAEIAALSRFHFHRVFSALTGETVAGAVRRIRMHRAAMWLAHTQMSVGEVSTRCGYDNGQSFARVFKSQTGMTPLQFRQRGVPEPDILPLKTGVSPMLPYEIKDLPDLRLVGLPHKGAYYEIGRAFEQVGAVFAAQNLWDQAVGMVGLYFDSLDEVEEADLNSFAGVVVKAEFDKPAALQDYLIPGGPHLVTTYKGPYAGLPKAWEDTYCNAVSQSGAELADRAPFESYLNSPMFVKPDALLTEICVPLVS
ncbi:AraC family transcriptional regulator [Pacificoceanicola onchidii]|uniref:AraC family transcriptional regulator n=1 Tax=Pacificoceanicola onchidii TaxID=2562685 RepID=UPI0010A5F9D3|nr:AraC family transcriptional regulator [Pacificoceanicola onchidii]